MEVEAKYRSPGNDRVEKALLRLGARKLSKVPMEDVYFGHPTRDFGKTDEALRLRKVEEDSELTYKGPRTIFGTAKAREEISLRTDNPLAVQRIVERLGFREMYVIKKVRTSYMLDELRVELDEVEGLGEFVELEMLTESPERTKELMEKARSELGLEKLEHKTYLEMIIERLSDKKE